MRKKYHIDLVEVARLNATGMNAAAIAKHLKVGLYALYLQCKEANVPLLRGRHPLPDGDIARRYAEGESILALANALGVKRGIVYGALRRQGIALRTQSEANVLMMQRAGPVERSRRAAAAHAAVRGMRHNHASLVLRAKNREGLVNGANEQRVYDLLRSHGMKPRPGFQVDVYNIDLAFPDAKLALEIDGGNWHSSPRKMRQDAAKTTFLNALGWRVVRMKFCKQRARLTDDQIMQQVRSALAAPAGDLG